MEAQLVANGGGDDLVPGLSFKIGKGASYVRGRRDVVWHPEGAAVYSPKNVRTLRFTLSDSFSFLDPHTVALSCDVVNVSPDTGDPATASPITFRSVNPTSIFERVRIYLGSQLIEDITYAGKLATLLDDWLPANRRHTKHGGGFKLPSSTAGQLVGNDAAAGAMFQGASAAAPILKDGTVKVTFPIFAGLFQQHLYIPLRHAPVTIELTLNQDLASVLIFASAAKGPVYNYELRRVRCLSSVVDVDMALTERINKHLLQGKSLPIPFSSWSTTMNSIAAPDAAGGDFSVQLGRQYTRVRLALAYLSSVQSETNETLRGDGSTVNSFPAPMNNRDYDAALDRMRVQLTAGALKWPEMPIESYSEAFHYALKAFNMLTGDEQAMSVPEAAYHWNHFCLAFDLEACGTGPGAHGANYTGLNLRATELLRLEYKDVRSGSDAARPVKVFMSLLYDAIAQVKLDAVDLFE